MRGIKLYTITEKARKLGDNLNFLYSELCNSEIDSTIDGIKNLLEINNHHDSVFEGDDLPTFIIKKILSSSNLSRQAAGFMMDLLEHEIFHVLTKSDRAPGPIRRPGSFMLSDTIPQHLKDGLIYHLDSNNYSCNHCFGVYGIQGTDLEDMETEGLLKSVTEEEKYEMLLEELHGDQFGNDLTKLRELIDLSNDKNSSSRSGCGDSHTLLSWMIFNKNECKEIEPIMELIEKGTSSINFVVDPITDQNIFLELTKKIVEFKEISVYLKDEAVDFIVDLEIAIKGNTEFYTDKMSLLVYFGLEFYSEGYTGLERYLKSKMNLNE